MPQIISQDEIVEGALFRVDRVQGQAVFVSVLDLEQPQVRTGPNWKKGIKQAKPNLGNGNNNNGNNGNNSVGRND